MALPCCTVCLSISSRSLRFSASSLSTSFSRSRILFTPARFVPISWVSFWMYLPSSTSSWEYNRVFFKLLRGQSRPFCSYIRNVCGWTPINSAAIPIMKTGLLRMLAANPLVRLARSGTQEPLAHVLVPLLGQGLQDLLLPPAELLGHDDPNPHHEVPGLAAVPRPRGTYPP